MTQKPFRLFLLLTVLIGRSGSASVAAADEVAKPGADPAANAAAQEAAKPAVADSAEQDPAKTGADPDPDTAKEGHSAHGEVFNEGPRQAAYLMDGVGTCHFPATTKVELAGKFIEQGVAQLHGFWYFESERSFRQAAMLDPECAIAYWGMAMSNRSNQKRAKDFIKEAMSRKDKAGKREQLYIQAFDRYINAKSGTEDEKRKRSERYVSDLEEILFDFPEDLEAKAFLCEFFWSARGDGLKIASYLSIDALIQEILDSEPLHPAHHYRIHLWDTKKPERALESSARCGLAAPAIAHMWHMPGHIYSRVKRYHDAVYQQEASARVDHAHMMKDRVLPDQIHNFAHNNEWCIRNMISIGRVHDGLALAQNMMSMPRHPKYNNIDKSGSFKYGRQRLLEVLKTYGMHEEIVQLGGTVWFEDTGNATEDLDRDRTLGAAYAATGRKDQAADMKASLQVRLDADKARQKEAGDAAEKKAREDKKDDKEAAKARKDAEEKARGKISDLEKAIAEIDGRLAVAAMEYDKGLELLQKAGGVRVEQLVAVMLLAGKTEEAAKKIEEHVRNNKNEVLPLASKVETLWQVGRKDDAKQALEELRAISSTIDIDIAPFARLSPIAAELGYENDWRLAAVVPDDIGARPDLDALGPLRWQPVAALPWSLTDQENQTRSLAEFRGRPVVVIFYLGYGCLHCAEQLQKFAPKYEEFRKAGFEVVAISTDKQENLKRALADYDPGVPFPLLADPEMSVFRSWRCFDDFEKSALHGTFVIDGAGRVRWQDISYEPFMDPDFVLKEAQRLLSQDKQVSPEEASSLTAAH